MKQALTFIIALCTFYTQAQVSLNMDSLFNWTDVTLTPSDNHFNTYNEIWGYAKDGNEYAIIGTTAGTHIFDVTDPANSTEVAFIEGALTGPEVVHRDYHDYGDHLYIVCDEGQSTLQIVDLSLLPNSAPVVYDSDELFPRCHNLFIDSVSARMYVCGGTKLFAVYSLANPALPTLLVDCPTDVPFWSSVGYVHDVYVRGDTAYLNAEQRGLFVVDFSNLSNIQMLGSLDVYTQSGYNHSGWLMDDEPFYALADETHGMDVKIIDMSDLEDLQVTDTIGSNINEFSIPHNLIYKDNILFVSHYFDGLYMFDCTDPAHPSLAGYYDTSTEMHQDDWYRGCWGVYPFLPSGNILVSDMQSGLWVLGSPLVSGVETIDVNTDAISVYPNPTTDLLYLPQVVGDAVFQIVDMRGKLAVNGNANGTIKVTDLSPGLYTLLLQNDEGAFHSRFVKR